MYKYVWFTEFCLTDNFCLVGRHYEWLDFILVEVVLILPSNTLINTLVSILKYTIYVFLITFVYQNIHKNGFRVNKY